MDKKEKYENLLLKVKGLLAGDEDWVGKLANVSAAIHDEMEFFWVGFYIADGDMLKLGPFQGPVACYRIKRGKGVCGASWERKETIVVPDVEKFPGHIACSSLSRSEIVVPIFANLHFADMHFLPSDTQEIIGVLDIDSRELATFDDMDKEYLEHLCQIVAQSLV